MQELIHLNKGMHALAKFDIMEKRSPFKHYKYEKQILGGWDNQLNNLFI